MKPKLSGDHVVDHSYGVNFKVFHVLGTSALSELANSPMCTKYGYARSIYYIFLAFEYHLWYRRVSSESRLPGLADIKQRTYVDQRSSVPPSSSERFEPYSIGNAHAENMTRHSRQRYGEIVILFNFMAITLTRNYLFTRQLIDTTRCCLACLAFAVRTRRSSLDSLPSDS